MNTEEAIYVMASDSVEPYYGDFLKKSQRASPARAEEAWQAYKAKLAQLRAEAKIALEGAIKEGTFEKMSPEEFKSLRGDIRERWDSRFTSYVSEERLSASSSRAKTYWYAGAMLVRSTDTGWKQEATPDSRDLDIDRRR